HLFILCVMFLETTVISNQLSPCGPEKCRYQTSIDKFSIAALQWTVMAKVMISRHKLSTSIAPDKILLFDYQGSRYLMVSARCHYGTVEAGHQIVLPAERYLKLSLFMTLH
ncbi:hypothetical protein L9F63_006890, partial [Diploptera punctata]